MNTNHRNGLSDHIPSPDIVYDKTFKYQVSNTFCTIVVNPRKVKELSSDFTELEVRTSITSFSTDL